MQVSLEQELELEAFKRYLKAKPEDTAGVAIEAFLTLLDQRSAYAKLQQRYHQALECLKIHATDDAAARVIVQQAEY